ncbi:MAG: DNA alkylation repair protein [Gemmatimonadales bacterium]
MSAAEILRRLRRLGSPARARGVASFFKTGPGQYGEGDRFLGIRVPVIRRLTREYRDVPERTVLSLLRSEWHEVRLLALCLLVDRHEGGNDLEQQRIFDLYLRHRAWVDNWDLVDASAAQIAGPHFRRGARGVRERLARSPRLWDRRIAVVSTYHDIRLGEFGPTLRLARCLFKDEQDLIHKAVGWMLREVGKRDRRTLERFLTTHASRMPRTMLRYAIERFPEPARRRYLRA